MRNYQHTIVAAILSAFSVITTSLYCQEIDLNIKSIHPENQSVLDSIDTSNIEFENAKAVEEFSKNLLLDLQKKGYINARKVDFEATEKGQFDLKIELGNRFRYINLRIKETQQELLGNFNEIISKDNILSINFDQLESLTQTILYELSKKGETFSSLKLANIKENSTQELTADLKIIHKSKRTINRIILRGYENFPNGFIKHKIRIREGQTFDKEELIKKSENFENINFATTIKPPEAQFTKDSTNIYMYLEKVNSNVFDGFIGFSNNESNNIEINGYIDLQLTNNLNLGETLIINYKNDGNEQQRFVAKGELPYLFKSPFSVGAGIDIFRKDTTFSTTDQHLKLNYQISSNLQLTANTRFLNSSVTNEDPEAGIVDQIERSNFNANFYGLGASYIKRRRIIGDFRSKTTAEIALYTGKRSTADNSLNQFKVDLYAEHSIKINKNNYLYLNTNGALLSSENYIDNELYRFGGLRSIRGFNENSLVASMYGAIQTEYRIYLSGELYTHTVLDYGYYENELEQLADNLYSFGFGFGLNTKSGVLRLIFANGASKQQEFSFENTQVHLSLNTFF